MKTHLSVGVTVLLSSITFAQTAPIPLIITRGTPSVINSSMRTLALVTDPTYSPPTASQLPDFEISVSATTATGIQAGQNIGASILITPENGFSEKLSLSCSGLPSGASCVFGSPLAQVDGSFMIPMTINTKPVSSAGASSTTPFSVPVYMAFPVVVFLLSKRGNAGAKHRSLSLAILGVASLGWVGCGNPYPTPIQVTSTITITAQTQSGLSHSAQITITVFNG